MDNLSSSEVVNRAVLSGKRLSEFVLAAFAIASLTYAVATAPRLGYDLALFQQGGQNWVNGNHSFDAGPGHLYPPFALPLFWPATLVSTHSLTIIWLLVNLAACGLVVYLASELFGGGWPGRALFLLGAILISLAPFRVTLRSGQMSLVITALLLGALLARRKGRWAVAGLLLGLSLVKYPMTLPFFLYIAWKKEWKITAVAVGLLAVLIVVASMQMSISPFEAITRYAHSVTEVYSSTTGGFVGATGLKSLLFSLTGDAYATNVIRIIITIIALVAMGVIFARSPGHEPLHYAGLAFFALWFTYHRIYDAVLCVIPAAVFIKMLSSRRHVALARIGLVGVGLFALSIPGLLTERLGLDPESLSSNPVGWLGLHIERLIVFGLFWTLLAVLARIGRKPEKGRVPSTTIKVDQLSPGTGWS